MYKLQVKFLKDICITGGVKSIVDVYGVRQECGDFSKSNTLIVTYTYQLDGRSRNCDA